MAIAMELTNPHSSGSEATTTEEKIKEMANQEYYDSSGGDDSATIEQDDNDTADTDLHTFRLVCKTFGMIGKMVWANHAQHDLGYTTLCLPPRTNTLMDLADVFLADGGALGRLVKTVRLTLYPSAHTIPIHRPIKKRSTGMPRQQRTAAEQQKRRVIATDYIRKTFRMSRNQVEFVQEATGIGCQAMFNVILHALSDVARMDIQVALPRYYGGIMEEHDYRGSSEIIKKLAKLPQISKMCLSLVMPERRGYCTLEASLTEMMQTCFKSTFCDTNITSLTVHDTTDCEPLFNEAIPALKGQETLDLLYDGEIWSPGLSVLREVHHAAPLRTLRMEYIFTEITEDEMPKTYLSEFLHGHRATLRVVELKGFVGDENCILYLVKMMRRQFRLQHCKVEFWSEDEPCPAFRQLLCYLAEFEIINDKDGLDYKHCYPLDKYILGGAG